MANSGSTKFPSLSQQRVPILAISSKGTVVKANGPARRILGNGSATIEGPNLGELIAGFFSSHEEPGGVATLALPPGGARDDLRLAIVVGGEADTEPVAAKETLRTPAEARTDTGDVEAGERRMVDYVAQELHGPMASILGLARVLSSRNQTLPAEAREEAASAIQSEAERGLAVLDSLLRLAQFRNRRGDSTAAVPVHAVLHRLIAEHQRHYPERRLSVTGDQRAFARADVLGLELAVGSLLANAEKQSPRGGTIEVRLYQEGGRVALMVLNEGQTLGARQYAQAWDGYTAMETPGLGLALCRELTESMGGRVWAGPRESGGSAFSISLPAETRPGRLEAMGRAEMAEAAVSAGHA